MNNNRRLKILTVEDDAGLRRSIASYLEDSGFTVLEAANGNEGIRIFREDRPDLVFTDLRMPDGNGIDLIRTISMESPHTPVVAISGTGDMGEAMEAMHSGAWDYISKPVRDMSVLEDVSRRLCERSVSIRGNLVPWRAF